MHATSRKLLIALLLCLVVVPAAGCERTAHFLAGTYTGPAPQKLDLGAENVIVRRIFTDDANRIHLMYVDRERYLESDPHSIDRVVRVLTREVPDAVHALDFQAGDRLRISTRFQGYSEAGDLARFVPNWPFDRYDEYLLGEHVLTSVEKIAR